MEGIEVLGGFKVAYVDSACGAVWADDAGVVFGISLLGNHEIFFIKCS